MAKITDLINEKTDCSGGPRCPDCGGKCHLYLPTVAYCDKCAARFELNELEDFAQFFRPVAAHAPKMDAPDLCGHVCQEPKGDHKHAIVGPPTIRPDFQVEPDEDERGPQETVALSNHMREKMELAPQVEEGRGARNPFNPANLEANAGLAATLWRGFCEKTKVAESNPDLEWWGFQWAAYAMAGLEALPSGATTKPIGGAPRWYTKEEMQSALIGRNYEPKIADELAAWFADLLQGAYEKGKSWPIGNVEEIAKRIGQHIWLRYRPSVEEVEEYTREIAAILAPWFTPASTPAPEIEQLRKERDEAESGRKHTHDWYASHYGKLQDWARKRLPENWSYEFFSCIANGTWGIRDVGEKYICNGGFEVEPSGYIKFTTAQEQILHDQSRRAEVAESQLSTLREALRKFGNHVNCDYHHFNPPKPCSCGFAALVAAPSTPAKQDCQHLHRVYRIGNTYCEDCKIWLHAGSVELEGPSTPRKGDEPWMT